MTWIWLTRLVPSAARECPRSELSRHTYRQGLRNHRSRSLDLAHVLEFLCSFSCCGCADGRDTEEGVEVIEGQSLGSGSHTMRWLIGRINTISADMAGHSESFKNLYYNDGSRA